MKQPVLATGLLNETPNSCARYVDKQCCNTATDTAWTTWISTSPRAPTPLAVLCTVLVTILWAAPPNPIEFYSTSIDKRN